MTQRGLPISVNPAISLMPCLITSAVAKICFTDSRYPSSPIESRAAQQVALKAPGRLPEKVGEKYNPPGQSAIV